MPNKLWAGIDIGKEHHHCVVIDEAGQRLFSSRIANDETALTTLIDEALTLAAGGELLWAIDLNRGGAALVIGLLAARSQPVAYLTGLMMHRAAAGYRGEGKTDARDAFVIADQARVRRDLGLLRPGDDIAVDLRILTGHRLDVVFDRTRQINRLRAQLLEVCPTLERALTLTNQGPLMLLTRYQTPSAIRRAGVARIEAWLRKQHVRGAAALAQKASVAAAQQSISLPGETVAAQMIARLAQAVITLDAEIAELDTAIEERFRRHRSADIIVSLPGFGPLLAAEFLAATGGDMAAFTSVDQLAGFAGLAPQPRDSGRINCQQANLCRQLFLDLSERIRRHQPARTYHAALDHDAQRVRNHHRESCRINTLCGQWCQQRTPRRHDDRSRDHDMDWIFLCPPSCTHE
ncbi:IS110 family transposase [Rhodococcus sp. IC4_135]|uniref:IS110 family transposase n=1 Tax=Rhodococcus sp. IC4_135 TaxID=2715537 RepID=UPI00142344F8|nr:IS110 family transposase [Rhodococcus sp. IC4_135]